MHTHTQTHKQTNTHTHTTNIHTYKDPKPHAYRLQLTSLNELITPETHRFLLELQLSRSFP